MYFDSENHKYYTDKDKTERMVNVSWMTNIFYAQKYTPNEYSNAYMNNGTTGHKILELVCKQASWKDIKPLYDSFFDDYRPSLKDGIKYLKRELSVAQWVLNEYLCHRDDRCGIIDLIYEKFNEIYVVDFKFAENESKKDTNYHKIQLAHYHFILSKEYPNQKIHLQNWYMKKETFEVVEVELTTELIEAYEGLYTFHKKVFPYIDKKLQIKLEK